MSRALVRAVETVLLAEDAMAATLFRDYPVGQAIDWSPNSGGRQRGRVIAHDVPRGAVQVKNAASGRDSWIAAARVMA